MKFTTDIILNAVKADMLYCNTPYISKQHIDDYVFIHIPTFIAKYVDLDSIYDCETEEYVEFDEETCIRDTFHPWYKISSMILDTEVGHHQYKMKFSRLNEDDVNLYFSYNIYDDKLEKPYVYMDRDE